MSRTAAIFDLDRTLINTSSAPVFQRHLAAAGLGDVPHLPLADAFLKYYETFGESWIMMQPAKLGVRSSKGWAIAGIHEAMVSAAAELETMLMPFAKVVFEQHRKNGDLLVMATTSPASWVRPFAERLGFDHVIATEWLDDGTHFTGEHNGRFVWGRAKQEAVSEWAEANGVDMARSTAYSDSYFDAPLLDAVGTAVAVNPDPRLTSVALLKGWQIRHLDKNEGVFKIAGRELQDWARPLMRPEFSTMADIHISGTENIPAEGPAIIVFNHRSYFDPTVMGYVSAKAGRPARSLGKKKVFDVPVIGRIMRGMGGVRVDRGTRSVEPLEAAAAALAGGELLMMAPEGTIPRGPAFFEPELKGRWGAARLAAMTKAPVIPVGLWGTEKVWPRSARLPNIDPRHRETVTATVGEPIDLKYKSADADTKRIMSALVDLLPDEARVRRTPTRDELLRTFPPGYKGDPEAELDRRPGFDTTAGESKKTGTKKSATKKKG